MRSLFFWFVYFTLDDLYKVEAVFIIVLDGNNTNCGDLPLSVHMVEKISPKSLQKEAFTHLNTTPTFIECN